MRFSFSKSISFICRPLKTADAEACARLHAGAFAHGWSPEEFENLIAGSGAYGDARFAIRQNALLGFILSRLAADEAEILTIAVDRPVRRNGHGSGLLSDHLETIRRAGAKKLFLEVAEDNTPALTLYMKFGFEKIGERPGYYRRGGHSSGNATIMGLDL